MSVGSLLEQFETLSDPREQAKCKHILSEIIFMAIIAVLCGFDSWTQIHLFAKTRKSWFTEFGLTLPEGLPSKDTFIRVFALLPPEELKGIFQSWLKDVMDNNGITGQIAVDGKALRATAKGRGANPAHMVNAWSTELGMCIGQQKVDEKSNEITAIPKLLESLEIQGCMISIDAAGTHKKTLKTIIDKGADGLLSVKGNQPNLMEEVEGEFNHLWSTTREEDDRVGQGFFEQMEQSHGRKDRRRCWVLPITDDMVECNKWQAKCLIAVQAERGLKGKSHDFTRFYICTRELDAETALKATRAHWGVENLLHWTLDIAFKEDQVKARVGYSGENLAVIRQWLLNMLKHNTTKKISMENKRKLCSIDDDYLLDCIERLKSHH